MSDAFVIIGSLLVFVAAILHLAIFFLESVFWSRPQVWRRFGVESQADADTIRPMAFNQGFYNVFLALGAGVGLVMIGSAGSRESGIALSVFALLSMLLAALVLAASQPRLWRAALVQGGPPLLGIVFLVLGLTTA